MVEGWVRDILRCPACGSRLRDGVGPDGGASPGEADDGVGPEGTLVCTGEACGLAYPVRDGIPVLLVDEASPGRA